MGGIYLGIDPDQLIALYGKPNKIDYDSARGDTWRYSDLGLRVKFRRGMAIAITIYRSTPAMNIRNASANIMHFDWSRLSARNTPEDFSRKFPKSRRTFYYIGHGEAIDLNLDNGSATLSRYP